ncbi:MAG: hypothetical protein ACRBN8_04940 [Nannocystales bacterium]
MSVWPLLLLLVASPIEIGAWSVPPSCASRAAFIEKVEAEAQTSSGSDEPPVLEADIHVEEVAVDHWRLRLRLRRDGRDDARSFDASSCAAVVEAAAVVVALRLVQARQDETSRSRAAVSVPEPPREPVPIPLPDPPSALPLATAPEPIPVETSRDPSQDQRSRVGGWVGVHQGLALGIAPGIGGGFGVDGGVTGQWWRAGLGVHAALRRTETHPDEPGIRGRFDLVTGESFACGTPKVGSLVFPICGRFAVSGMRAVGEGAVRTSESVWGTWLGAGGSAGLAWHVTERVAPALSAVALAPLQDWAFSVGDAPGTLHRTGPVALRVWAGLEIHW